MHFSHISNFEATFFLPYQLQKKIEALEYLKGDVNRVWTACKELRAQARTQALEEISASARILAFEVQLNLTRGNAKFQTDMIERLESDLSKVRAEIIKARAEAELS